jgi:hypothetical protein|tara:strand:- start:2291 stop:2512 length:222 start_codon:yes stop_codon:yes gene_type:complete
MPLPSKKDKEPQSEFISRCMGDSVMNKEFKNKNQRAAVCYNQYKKAKKVRASDHKSCKDPFWDEFSNEFFTIY